MTTNDIIILGFSLTENVLFVTDDVTQNAILQEKFVSKTIPLLTKFCGFYNAKNATAAGSSHFTLTNL